MNKDPAFLFYPGDWLEGTQLFTRAHKGAYMDLLMAQNANGHLSPDDVKHVLGEDYETMWESKLKAKFTVDASGLFFNKKLQSVIDERNEYKAGRLKNLAGKKHYHKDGPYGKSICRDRDIDINKTTKGGVGGTEIPGHLLEVWPHFVEVRKKKRAPLTDRAIKNIISTLSEYDTATQVAMIEQSITRGYTGVFPVDGKTATKKPTNMPKL